MSSVALGSRLHFWILDVAEGIAAGLFLDGKAEFFGEIDARLVGQTKQDPENIGHFLTEVWLFAWLEALVAIFTSDDASQLTHLFSEASHVGELGEIAYAILLNPLIYSELCFLDGHILMFFHFLRKSVMRKMMMAPNMI